MTVKEKILEHLEKEKKGSLNRESEYLIAKMPDVANFHKVEAHDYERAIVIVRRRMADF